MYRRLHLGFNPRIFFCDMDSRVVHIDTGGEWRGGQRQLYLLALEQRARGTEPLVVSQPRSRLVMRLRNSGVASSGVRMRAQWDLNAVRRIRRLVRMWHPTIVHVHDSRAHALARKALVGLPTIRLIVTCRAKPKRAGSLNRSGQRYSRFIAPNGDIAQFLTTVGVHPSNIEVVAPGVPAYGEVHPRDWRTECRWPAQTVVCGVIGVSGAVVDPQLRRVLSHIPPATRSRVRLVVLGGISSGTAVISGTAAFAAGFVDDVAAAIAGFDLLINLSGSESMSTAVLDAMSLGVPPVAYDSGGAGEYIEHERSGLVAPYGDSVAFAAAVSSLVTDEELRDTLAAFGPGRATKFSVSKMADQTELCYRKALGGAGRGTTGYLSA